MIDIKHNNIPKLRMPKFNVDTELAEKLNDYDITKLMNKSNFTLFLGKAGSGKSSLLISFLKTPELFKRVYHTILLFMPPNSRQSIKDSFFDKHLPEDQIFDDVSVENLESAYTIAEANAAEGFNTLMVFDDVQKYFKGENEKFLLHMINNRRHARLSLWFAVQTYMSIPRQVRQGITDMFVFKINKIEMENIFAEQIEQHKDKFIEILTLVFQKNHDFLYINTNSQRTFSNWNELILEH
jgi:energy-coupling factor transporter ATP-binding protein EcfA2